MDTELRSRVKESVLGLVEQLSAELRLPRAAIADIAYLYLQKHPTWGRNPSKSQKRAAHNHWKGACQECAGPVEFSEAVFHHRQRRIDEQHSPQNLLPYHDSCHDKHHGVVSGSLSKGSPKRKRGK
jgi:hypothetical protein